MNTKIKISKIKNHFFLKIKNDDEDEQIHKNTKNNLKNYKSKIKEYNFYAINEFKICKIIKKIPYYFNSYLIVEDYDFIDVRQLNDRIIEKLNIDIKDESVKTKDEQKMKEYILFKYRNENILYFNDFLFDFYKPKKLIFYLINTFKYLLQNLIQLNENDICFFNLSFENIAFKIECREKPLFKDFELSLQISKTNHEYISNIIKKTYDFSLKPLEVHILFYLITKNITTISYSFIEEICEIYIKNLHILNFFSEKYKENYKVACVQCLKKYINCPRKEIIEDIIKKINKWDIYSLSHLFLHIFVNLSKSFSLSGTFINKFSIELSKNIHPDFSNRSSLEDLLQKFNELLSNEKDWSFVNKIEDSKIVQLFEVLSE